MSYQGYVAAAYLVFAAALSWDFVVPRLQLRQQLRAARLRAGRRQSAPPLPDPSAPLQRD
jgi:heme exporter protein D